MCFQRRSYLSEKKYDERDRVFSRVAKDLDAGFRTSQIPWIPDGSSATVFIDMVRFID